MMKIVEVFDYFGHNHGRCFLKNWWEKLLDVTCKENFCLRGHNGQFCRSFWFESASSEKLRIRTKSFQNQGLYLIWYVVYMFWIWPQTGLFFKSYEFLFEKSVKESPQLKSGKKHGFQKKIPSHLFMSDTKFLETEYYEIPIPTESVIKI